MRSLVACGPRYSRLADSILTSAVPMKGDTS